VSDGFEGYCLRRRRTRGVLASARSLGFGERILDLAPTDETAIKASSEIAAKANLWLFDFFYDGTGDGSPLTLTSDNGLSVFAQWRSVFGDARPPTVLISADLERALGEPVRAERRHILAEHNTVEWIASRIAPETPAEIRDLADACGHLRAKITECRHLDGAISSEALLAGALKLAETSWSRAAFRQIDRARPPHFQTDSPSPNVTTAGEPDSGIGAARGILAWLLHKVLPYPSFLLNERQAAVRLGLTLTSFREITALDSKSDLSCALAECKYGGVLAAFDGGVLVWNC
jgi:hypothetical protein